MAKPLIMRRHVAARELNFCSSGGLEALGLRGQVAKNEKTDLPILQPLRSGRWAERRPIRGKKWIMKPGVPDKRLWKL
jgi:hypothetical protein